MDVTLLWLSLGAFALATLASFFAEKKWIPFLMRIKMGQTILEIGPRWHKSKEGTPTMGGIFFIGAVFLTLAAFALPLAIREGDYTFLKVFGMALLFGGIGFIDDFVKFVKKRNKGLTALQKLVLQFAAAALFLFLMRDQLTTSLALPFTDTRLELGVFYWIFSAVFIVYVTNCANLTDGIDGLAAGASFVIFLFFTVTAYMAKNAVGSVYHAALCGGMIGFLFYNYHPARIFMGDTGSLFLGGVIAGTAFWLDSPLIALFTALWMIWEGVSVMLQVASFKLFKKRIFKMAPFHHHLEMKGWKETKIVAVAALFTALCCIFCYFAYWF